MSATAPMTMDGDWDWRETRRLCSADRLLPGLLRDGSRRAGTGGRSHQQVGLVPDEVVLAVDGELVVLAHEDRRHRTRFLTHAAEDAARLVNLVDLRVARTGHHRPVVLSRLEIDRIGRARHRTETARDALLEAVLVPHQHLLAAVLREHRKLLVRVVHGHLRLEHVAEGGQETGNQRADHPHYDNSFTPNSQLRRRSNSRCPDSVRFESWVSFSR